MLILCHRLDSRHQGHHNQQPDADAHHAEEPDLAIAQLLDLGEYLPPFGRGRERHQAFNDERQTQPQAKHLPETQRNQGANRRQSGDYFFAGAAGAALPLKALKNSEEDGSTTITSPFLLKLPR